MREPVGQGGLGVGLDLAVRDMADPAALDADHAPASAGQRGVEAEDDHDRKPLPFRGGVGVGAVEVARGRWPPPPVPPLKGRGDRFTPVSPSPRRGSRERKRTRMKSVSTANPDCSLVLEANTINTHQTI